MNAEVTAGILAGGESARFGTDKALYIWRGKPLVSHVADALRPEVAEIFVVAKQTAPFNFLVRSGIRVVPDGRPESNPFWGLVAALGALGTPWLFLCPCDAPLVQPALLRALFEARGDAKAVAPVWGGTEQPLPALYHRDCLNPAREIAARSGNPSPRMLLQAVENRLLTEEEVRLCDPEGLSFRDADREEDLLGLDGLGGATDAR